jgi:hypothetical protein
MPAYIIYIAIIIALRCAMADIKPPYLGRK